MNRCRECGASIDEIQARNFNNLCPSCIRIRKSSAPLATIAKSEAQSWLGLAIAGGVVIISAIFLSITILPMFSEDSPAAMFPLFGIIVGSGMILVGLLMYKGAQS